MCRCAGAEYMQKHNCKFCGIQTKLNEDGFCSFECKIRDADRRKKDDLGLSE